jgi:subtilisin family serine protease
VNGWRPRARQRRTPRFAGLLLVLGVIGVSVAGGAAGAGPRWSVSGSLTPDSTFTAAKSSSGYLAQTDPTLLNQTSSSPVNVMIKYDFDATASYTGGVAGLAPTSPRATGKSLKANAAAVAAYESYTSRRADAISAAVRQAVPSADIRQTFQTAYGGVEAQVPANTVNALLQVPGVAAVQRDTLEQPQDDNTQFIGATAVWPSLGGSTTAGSNVIVGVIDTGVWPEHPMLADHGLPATGGSYACQFGSGTDVAHLGAPFVCNNKLIGAYAFTQTYMANLGSDGQEFCNNTTHECSARDPEGHGTHTTTTAAGDCVTTAVLYGAERGPVCGIAPGAHVIQYRVCMALGCFSSDSVHAVQQAITDGVNVINFSISGGANPYTDPVELAFLDAVNAGISVNASAGNSGPGSGTSDHGGPWTTTVGASTGPRSFTSTLHLTADGGATFDMAGFTLTNGISSPTPVVLAESISPDAICSKPLAAGTATGKVVACQRGTNARIDKGFNVLAGGAAGMILYNPVAQDVETDNHWLPAIHVDGPPTALLAFINGHTNVMATWAQGTAKATPADVMASFSSRGPTGDFIKPDVTAPGIQVLAGMTPQPDQTTPTNGPSGNLYQAIAGTSMSGPHAAGVAALVKAAHPSWTPEEIKSALMTSAVQAVKKEDGVTAATPFDDGAGSIRADRAINPTLVFNETYAHFVASAGDPLHRVDLNLASIDATTMPGLLKTQRTGINVSGKPMTLGIQTSMPGGVTVLVGDNTDPGNPKPLHVGKDDSITFPITIDATNVANGQYFGWIRLVPPSGATPVFMPVAFVKKQGLVTLSNSCSPNTVPASRGTTLGLSHCTTSVSNFGSSAANVNLSVQPLENKLNYTNIGPPGTVIGDNAGVQWSGTLTPAVPPQITSITPTTAANSPAGGYLPLSAFGIPAIAGVGDETITNFNVPTFYFGSEPYSKVGVVSNGYLVLGGGTSADIKFMPQHFPDPARPNNVIAPWWTDFNLNPATGGAGSIRIGTLTDGSDSWLIVDWEAVKNFGNATTHTFEIWLRLAGGAAGAGASSEQTTMSYDANAGGGDPDSGSNWGAENRDGSSGVNLASPPATGSEYAVNTSPPAAGGTTTLTYDVWSKFAGTYHSVASMTSDLTPGVTQVSQTITVTP